jgi:L-asparagine transporter-like permease
MNILFLFIFTCLLSRVILIYLARNSSTEQLRFLSVPAILIGVYAIIISVKKNLRKEEEKEETKKDLWWKSFRNLHAFLFILFGILAMKGYKKSYIVLIIDLIISTISFIYYYYN